MKSTLSMLSSSNMYLYPATGLHKSVLYFLCLLWFSENECQKENLTLFWKWVLCDITKGTDSFSRFMTTVSASCLFCWVTSPHSCFFLKEKPSNMGANSVFLLRAVNRWLNSAFWNKTSKKRLVLWNAIRCISGGVWFQFFLVLFASNTAKCTET